MGINQAKQEAKALKKAMQEAGHIEDDLINEQRRQGLNDALKNRKLAGREAAAQRYLEKQELELLKRKKKD
ncbi:hypothetical protein HQ393_12315 [Chitinibacter bivalviorum]|uniref:Uncharacterized protein n=1 Tax=Chitinibacter bivalviorum TaxID=2739434 RepID=A0A7H9BKV1_9NEIS|nr:hypothetical protein [Chitinibacter bivalviorum]QLG88956.1 hypothetical protein HQ393_12315 [Chitinibacter bivalviorum]